MTVSVSVITHPFGMNNKDRIWYLISKKMSGEAQAEELAELEELLRSDPEMHYALQHLNDLWHLPARPDAEATEALERHLARLQSTDTDWQPPTLTEPAYTDYPFPPEKKSFRSFIWAGAIIAILIVSGIFLFQQPQPEKSLSDKVQPGTTKNEVSTRNGSRTKISLPDGSQVWLNAGSKIVYNKEFGNNFREVQLSGEAFFDVVKNTEVPFIIHTKQVDIRVVGTAFNVKSYPADRQTETSLVRGVVEITIHNRPEEKIILQPNEKIVVADTEKRVDATTPADTNEPFVSMSKLTYTKADSIVVETAWVEDKLVFDNESLRAVTAKMERWYNVEFEFHNTSNRELRFSGVFQNETIHQALEALAITAEHKFRYTIQGKKVIMTIK